MGVRGEREDLRERTFGDLLVIKEAYSRWENNRVRYYWTVQCICGIVFDARGAALKYGSPTSCFDCGIKKRVKTRKTNGKIR